MLENKTLVELRGIAQSFGVSDIFAKTDVQLRQEISLKQTDMMPKPVVEIPKPEYDARLMTRPPSQKSTRELAEELLQPYVDRGMTLTYPNEEEWHMRHGKREDTGTMRMPIRIMLQCADRIMK